MGQDRPSRYPNSATRLFVVTSSEVKVLSNSFLTALVYKQYSKGGFCQYSCATFHPVRANKSKSSSFVKWNIFSFLGYGLLLPLLRLLAFIPADLHKRFKRPPVKRRPSRETNERSTGPFWQTGEPILSTITRLIKRFPPGLQQRYASKSARNGSEKRSNTERM